MKPEQAVKFDRTFGRPFYRMHRAVYRLTGGRLGQRLQGLPMLLLTTIGRKSGQPRETPLMYYPDDDRMVVVASNGGRPETPAWLLNIRANPDVTVQLGGRRMRARARVLDPDERAQRWPELTRFYHGWAHYETITEREIPVVVLDPQD